MSNIVLEHSPLVMVLIEVRFTPLPQKHLEAGLEDFKSTLFEHELPDFHETDISQVEGKPNESGQLEFKTIMGKRWDFISLNRDLGVTLARDSICFRATTYSHFGDFKKRWSLVIQAFFASFFHANKAGIQRMGLRYMDVFLPQQNEAYTDYINNDWLSKRQVDGDTSSLSSYKQQARTMSGLLRLELEERSSENGNVSIFPKDINDPDPVALQVQVKELWKTAVPKKYAILDIDHIWAAENRELKALNLDNVLAITDSLHEDCANIFWNIISKHAEEKWNKGHLEIRQ